MAMSFKKWLENTGQSRIHPDFQPASRIPHIIAKIDAARGVGAFNGIDPPLPGNKRSMKKMKKSKKN